MSSIYEIVTYTVTDKDKAESDRKNARKVLSGYPGFVSWTCFSESGDGKHFVDLVEWDCFENAKAAQDKFPQDPDMKALMSVLDQCLAMVHVRKV